MKKKIASLIISLTIIFTFCSQSFAAEHYTLENKSNFTEFVGDSEYLQKHRSELYEKMVDPGKAMAFSALYFGLGQIYAGENLKGGLILAGGTILTGITLIFILPYVRERQESVRNNGTALAVGAIALAYLLNVRDAYVTAENINQRIQKELLLSDGLIKELEKLSFDAEKSEFSYKLVSF